MTDLTRPESDVPFFIIGNPRSGTTMFRLMLNSHPALVVPPECGFAVWWLPKYKAARFDGPDCAARIDQFLLDLETSRKIETWHLDFARLRDLLVSTRVATYSQVVTAVYRAYAASRGRPASICGDKNNFHIRHVSDIAALFPKATFLFLVRDGRDVAASYMELAKRPFDSPYAPKLPTEIGAIAEEWCINNTTALTALSLLSRQSWLQVRYEDLVTHPQRTLSHVCAFLHVPFVEEMLQFHKHVRDEEPADFIAWKGKVTEGVTASSVGRYRDVLSDEQLRSFTDRAGAALRHFGYLDRSDAGAE